MICSFSCEFAKDQYAAVSFSSSEIWAHVLEQVEARGKILPGVEKRTQGRTGGKKGLIILGIHGH